MLRSLLNIWNPGVYHGVNKRAPYFEGWYFKIVDPVFKKSYAIIPGVFLDRTPEKSHCFIQFLDSQSHKTSYHRYTLNQFYADPKKFDITIGKNRFNLNHISVDLDSNGNKVVGRLVFSEHSPWPVSLISPGVMGWYSFLPAMECYHGVLSIDHHISGKLTIDNKTIDFSGGRGYLEKDWGISFPSAYVWMQSNHFNQSGTSIFISIAKIPWRGSAFRGFLAGLLHKGRLYRLTTYTGAEIKKLNISQNEVRVKIRDRRYELDVIAERSEGGVLFGPDGQSFFQQISETLQSKIHLVFKGDDIDLVQDTGFPAALDVNGDPREITN